MPAALINQLLIAGVVIAATTIIHAISAVMMREISHTIRHGKPLGDVSGVIALVFVSLWLIGTHFLSACVWAVAYVWAGVSPHPEEGLYFALTTYTTLGFGDILAPEGFRLLTGLASLNGLLLFGLSSAILVDAASWLRRSE
ncbi:MAG: ion channel [Pseudomonadota bacterium]